MSSTNRNWFDINLVLSLSVCVWICGRSTWNFTYKITCYPTVHLIVVLFPCYRPQVCHRARTQTQTHRICWKDFYQNKCQQTASKWVQQASKHSAYGIRICKMYIYNGQLSPMASEEKERERERKWKTIFGIETWNRYINIGQWNVCLESQNVHMSIFYGVWLLLLVSSTIAYGGH